MSTIIRNLVILIIIFSVLPATVFSQKEESDEYAFPSEVPAAPLEREFLKDFGYSVFGVVTSNLMLNLPLRFVGQRFANTTYLTVWKSIVDNGWFWESGDRFLINQFGHPYQGAMYLASARVNGFNFYQSLLFVPFGSVMWELVCEHHPSINDLITTTIGGISLGEMLYRLFLEVDAKPSVGGKIGGFIISPSSSYNKIYNRPRETGGGNIYDMSLAFGVEKTFALFPGHEIEADSWKYPGLQIDVNIVYGDPYEQQSKTPYEHFEFNAGIVSNFSSYHVVIISDGYLFSYNPVLTDTKVTSTGLSLHYDLFLATNEFIDTSGNGNIMFSSSALSWTVKHNYRPSRNYQFEIKAHAGVTLWGNSVYKSNFAVKNDNYNVPDGNSRNLYGIGENLKLFFTFSHNKLGKIEFAFFGCHLFAIPLNYTFSSGNALFLYGSLSYEYPLTALLSIGVKGTFWGLFSFTKTAEDINRSLLSPGLYVSFRF